MRHFIVAAFAIIAAFGAQSAAAADKNPFEIKDDGYHRGTVIVAIDDVPGPWRGIGSPPLNFELFVTWFDPDKKKPHVELHWVANPNVADFKVVTDDQGHRFMVGSMGEGEAVIAAYYSQRAWGMCYNLETYHFYVKRGTYNFIGRFDDLPSFQAIDDAIGSGQLPAAVKDTDYAPVLTDQKLQGFTMADELPGMEPRIQDLATKALGHPIEIVKPTLTETDYNLSKNPLGQTLCSFWAGSGDRPDRTKPAAPTAPAVDGAAKPASTTTWVSRPKEPATPQ